MELQIVLAAVGIIGVLDLPKIIVLVEFDLSPICEALVAQHGLDPGPLFGTGWPVGEHLSRRQHACCCYDETKYDLSDGWHGTTPRLTRPQTQTGRAGFQRYAGYRSERYPFRQDPIFVRIQSSDRYQC